MLFYCVFALLPFFLYDWIQEDVRPTVQAESLRDLYAVAPNGLGAISTTALLAIIVRPQIPIVCGLISNAYTAASDSPANRRDCAGAFTIDPCFISQDTSVLDTELAASQSKFSGAPRLTSNRAGCTNWSAKRYASVGIPLERE